MKNKQNNKQLLLTPGPTNIPEDIKFAMSEEILHHRLPEFKKLLKGINKDLSYIFQTKNDVLSFTSSGTGAMEATIVNFLSFKDKILLINTGYFGNHYKKIVIKYDLKIVELAYQYGETYVLDDVKKALKEHLDIKAILVTHSETSTGIINDLKSLGKLTKDRDTLLLVDSISGLVNNELYFDKWNLDVVVSASQKGFLLPPGLSFLAYSDKAWKRAQTSNIPNAYFNIIDYVNQLKILGTLPFTPAISHYLGLEKSISNIKKIGLEKYWKWKTELKNYFLDELEKIGFVSKIKNKSQQSNSLLTMYHPKIKDYEAYLKELVKERITIAPAIGEWKNKAIRIGLLGAIDNALIERIIKIMKKKIKS